MQKVLVLPARRVGPGKGEGHRGARRGARASGDGRERPLLLHRGRPGRHFPARLAESLAWADVVLDHLYHADLTGYLLERCAEPACPWWPRDENSRRGLYAYDLLHPGPDRGPRRLRPPVRRAGVRRGGRRRSGGLGSTCSAARPAPPPGALRERRGLTVEDALPRIGLATQFTATPRPTRTYSSRTPPRGRRVHTAALKKAVAKGQER